LPLVHLASAPRILITEPGRDLVCGTVPEAALLAVVATLILTSVALVSAIEAAGVVIPAEAAALTTSAILSVAISAS
jgi:hypothetical protein